MVTSLFFQVHISELRFALYSGGALNSNKHSINFTLLMGCLDIRFGQ